MTPYGQTSSVQEEIAFMMECVLWANLRTSRALCTAIEQYTNKNLNHLRSEVLDSYPALALHSLTLSRGIWVRECLNIFPALPEVTLTILLYNYELVGTMKVFIGYVQYR